VQITDGERRVLAEWVPGIDLLKVKIKTGKFAEVLCECLGACAVTSGRAIYARKDSWICQYPPEHPLRLALLIH